MNWRKLLLGTLIVSLAIEVLWPILGFFAPSFTLGLFKVAVNADTLFLAFVLAWCLLFVALACGQALLWVKRNVAAGWTLSLILGGWWIGIGVALFAFHGKLENLFLDGLKGAILVAAALKTPRPAA